MPKKSMRVECGKYLVEMGDKNNDIVVLDADLKDSTQSVQFQKAFPDRFIDVGIAEQNMVGIAAGLSLSGKIPIVHSFACFISMRACEQVRTTIAYPKLNVKFVVSHGGISSGSAGTTHHAIEDIAIMRAIPNMTVLVPGDAEEAKQVLHEALEHDGPAYIRLSASDTEDALMGKDVFTIGKGTLLKEGNDACIITSGTTKLAGLEAADRLLEKGLKIKVLQMASIKPIDERMIKEAARETKAVVTVEEHNILGGLGGAVCEVVAEMGGVRVKRLGIKDRFCGIGTEACLMDEEEITVQAIVDNVLEMVK